jgi:hypothetical protein
VDIHGALQSFHSKTVFEYFDVSIGKLDANIKGIGRWCGGVLIGNR